MGEKFSRFNDEWPAGYRDGDSVSYHGQRAHVISASPEVVPKGFVPIVVDNGLQKKTGLVLVPADDLERIKEDWEA